MWTGRSSERWQCGAQEFLIYVLAAFLLTWSEQLRTLEFQDLVMFLQASVCAVSL